MSRHAEEDPSAFRRGLQRTLVYFGLAAEADDPEQPADPSPWWVQAGWAAFLGFALTGLAWDQRGAGLGAFSLVGFAILVALNGPWPESRRRQRAESALGCFVILPVGLAVLVPDHVDVWIPIGIGVAVAVLLTVVSTRVSSRGDANTGVPARPRQR